jgi:hypothetical protein
LIAPVAIAQPRTGSGLPSITQIADRRASRQAVSNICSSGR